MTEIEPIQFVPQLYKQRYSKVLHILSKEKPKKVIDYGCAECKLIQLLKGEEYIEEICGVDIDRSILEDSKWRTEPLTSDYINPRTLPLSISLLHGSALTPCRNVLDFDAVTCIEVVEHLPCSQLSGFRENIFGFIRPNLAIISTPNADFNVLFPMTAKHRHWDHKFEWTTEEFQNWCNEICQLFNYSVDFDGVGTPPDDHKHLGYCSQFAIFHKLGDLIKIESEDIKRNGIKDINSKLEAVFVSIHPFLSIEDRKERKVYAKFCSYIDALMSACNAMLRSLKENTENHDCLNALQKTFMNLRLKNASSPIYKNTFKKPMASTSYEQFTDSEDVVCNGFVPTNIYGQERVLAVVEPTKDVCDYLQKLRDSYVCGNNVLPTPGQFEDCELEQSKAVKFESKYNLDRINQDQLVDLSLYDPEMRFLVLVTERSYVPGGDDSNHIVLYRSSNLLNVSFTVLSEIDEIKDLNLSKAELENVIEKERPEGIELLRESNGSCLLIDMEIADTLNRVKRWPSVSSASTSSSGSLVNISTFTQEEFFEENWDSD